MTDNLAARAFRAILLTATSLCPFAAQAQEIVVTGQNVPLDTPNESGSRLNLSLLETPGSVALVDAAEARARGDFTIQDAVTRAVGITNVGNPGNGGTALEARGFGGQGSVLQLVDGIRLFPVAGTITFPVDIWTVERVDVLSGPASVLYGQGALGGAINVVTRKPNRMRYELEAEGGYGSQNSWHLAGGAGGPILAEKVAFRVDGSYRQSDGYVDRGKSDSVALSGALSITPSEQLTVTLRHDYGDQHPMRYFGTPLIDSRLDPSIRHNNYNVGDSEMHFRDNRSTVTVDWSPSSAVTINNTVYRLATRRKWRNLETYCWIAASGDCPNGIGYGTPGNVYRADNFGIVHDQVQWGDQASARFSSPMGGDIRNDLVVGFDANWVKLTYSHDFASDYQEDEVPRQNFNPGLFLDTVGIAPRYRTRTTEYAVFAEDRLQLTKQLSLVAGLRIEHDKTGRWTFVYNSAGTAIVGETPALNGGNNAYRRFGDATWRVGGVYQPTSSVSLYAQYSTGVDPMGTLTTYSTSGAQYAFTNAKGEQVEAGVKASFLGGKGSATLAAYRIVKHNLAAQRATNGPIEQIGQRSSQGVEASVSVELPGGFGVDANGTMLDARYDNFISGNTDYRGNTPPNVPETAGNLWLRWDATKTAQARVGVRYVGRTFSDDANRFRIPGYAVFDAALSYAVTSNVAVDLRLYNLLDRNYAVTTYSDEQWILGRPRSVDVSLRARF